MQVRKRARHLLHALQRVYQIRQLPVLEEHRQARASIQSLHLA